MPEDLHLLIVEDDKDMAARMAGEAAALGIHIETAETVSAAKRQSAQRLPDIVVLDRMLADGSDGLEYVHWLNALEGKRPGILVASRLTSVSDHVLGLETGADDYINKPFETAEFRARLRAVVRRAGNGDVFLARPEIPVENLVQPRHRLGPQPDRRRRRRCCQRQLVP